MQPRSKALHAHLVLLDDSKQRMLHGARHVRGVAADVEVAARAQQAPDQAPALRQQVLHVHLARLHREARNPVLSAL